MTPEIRIHTGLGPPRLDVAGNSLGKFGSNSENLGSGRRPKP